MGVISGNDPRNGDAPFVNQVFIGVTGGAATAVSDAFMTIIDIGNAGLCRHDSIEVDELHHPLHIVRRSIVPDTEGAGRYRGAPSIYSEFGPIPGCSMKVLYTSDGTINHAVGVLGGGGGGPSRALKTGARRISRSCRPATAHSWNPASSLSPIRQAVAVTATRSNEIRSECYTISRKAGSPPNAPDQSMASPPQTATNTALRLSTDQRRRR